MTELTGLDKGFVRRAGGRIEIGAYLRVVFREQGVDLARRDVGDFGSGMGAVGQDAGFRARERNRPAAERIDRHRNERDRRLLASRQQNIQLPLLRLRRGLTRELDQVISHSRHRGNDGHDSATLLLGLENFARDIPDALGRPDRGAAVFLDDQAHGAVGTE